MELSQNEKNIIDVLDKLDMGRMEESVDMSCLKRVRGIINHATGNAAELDTGRMEESAAMARSQRSR